MSRARSTSPSGFPTANASPRGWACSSSSDSFAVPWAPCAVQSMISRRELTTRESSAAPTRRCGRCLSWAAHSPGWIATGALRLSSRHSPLRRDWTTSRCRRTSAVSAASSAFSCAVGGTRTPRRVASRSTSCGASGERGSLSLHVGRYAYLQSHRSEYRAACRTAEEALRLAVEVSDAYHYMACQFHRAWALLHLGEWGETAPSPPRRARDGGAQRPSTSGRGHSVSRQRGCARTWVILQGLVRSASGSGGPARRSSWRASSAPSSSGSPSLDRGGTRRPCAHSRKSPARREGPVGLDGLDSQHADAAGTRPVLARAPAVRARTGTDAGALSARRRPRRAHVPRTRSSRARRGRSRRGRSRHGRARGVAGAPRARRIRGAAGRVESLRHSRARRGGARSTVEGRGLLGPRRRGARSTGDPPEGRRGSASILPRPTSRRGHAPEREADGPHCAAREGLDPRPCRSALQLVTPPSASSSSVPGAPELSGQAPAA